MLERDKDHCDTWYVLDAGREVLHNHCPSQSLTTSTRSNYPEVEQLVQPVPDEDILARPLRTWIMQ